MHSAASFRAFSAQSAGAQHGLSQGSPAAELRAGRAQLLVIGPVNERSQVPLVLSLAVKGPMRWPVDIPVLAPVFVNENVTADQV
jgi:hypothetical protein